MGYYVSEHDLVQGQVAVWIFGTLSNLVTTGILFWICAKTSTNKMIGRLVVNLLISDWVQSFGFVMSSNWIFQGGIYEGFFCTIQGMFLNLGDVASVVHSYESKYHLVISMAVIWPANLLMIFIGHAIQTKKNGSFWAPAGGAWCWISINYPLYRILFHYGIIVLLAVFMVGMYAVMYMSLWRRQNTTQREASRQVLQRTSKKLVYYPVAYVILVFPLAFQRFLAFGGIQMPFPFLVAAGCIFALSGIVNSIIYGFTRHVVTITPNISFRQVQKRPISTSNGIDSSKPMNTFTISVTTQTETRLSHWNPNLKEVEI
ncbi:hypothetical protein G9A89_002930 [Geosiphon pyriformis]|nr:hypothetical protein G9A89_002930 [Geosiphon pyriformis]